jgi:hypothetical protein
MKIQSTLSDRQAKISAEAQAPKPTKIPDNSLPLRKDGTVQLPWISRFEHKR